MTSTNPPTEYAYFNQQIRPLSECNISIKTHAFMYGTSIFEGIRGYYLEETNEVAIFRMREHYERMLANSKLFYLTPEHSLDDLIKITIDLVKKNQATTDIYIRPTLFKTGTNITPSLVNTDTDFCLFTHPLGNYLDINKGLNVCVSNWRRVDDNAIPPRTKAAACYMNTALMVTDARYNGFDDAISINPDGSISEGSAMNLFLIKDNTLITPGKTDNILEGITRDTIIQLAKHELGIHTVERTVDRTELYLCDEAFFCGTGAQVAGIASIDGRPVGNIKQNDGQNSALGQVGPITKQLQTLYFETVRAQRSPNRAIQDGDRWITRVPLES